MWYVYCQLSATGYCVHTWAHVQLKLHTFTFTMYIHTCTCRYVCITRSNHEGNNLTTTSNNQQKYLVTLDLFQISDFRLLKKSKKPHIPVRVPGPVHVHVPCTYIHVHSTYYTWSTLGTCMYMWPHRYLLLKRPGTGTGTSDFTDS